MNKGKFKPFTEGHLSSVLDNRMFQLHERIYQENENYLLNVNEDEYINHIISQFTIDCPVLDFESKFITSEERMIEARLHPGDFFIRDGESYSRQVITFHLPFSGDINILDFMPSPAILWTSPFEHIINSEGEFLTFDLINFSNSSEQLKNESDRVITNLKTQLGHIKNQVDGFNSGLKAEVEQSVNGRKKDLLSKNDFLTTLGIPIKKKDNLPNTFAVPVPKIPKKIVPRPSASSAKPEPAVDTETYNAILQVIHDLGKAIERMPSTYAGKDEESLRDYFLINLEPRFEGSVTGETFNKTGKTDILLRYQNTNVFVAECKFWKGESKFLETIDQILGYLTWRDSKSSIMLFVQNLDFTNVVKAIPDYLAKHPNFISIENNEAEGTFLRCKFHLNGDKERLLFMTILLFHFPPLKNHL